jgi:hypothetical protein
VTSALAAEIVREATRAGRSSGSSSFAEYRSASASGRAVMTTPDAVLWKYLTTVSAKGHYLEMPVGDLHDAPVLDGFAELDRFDD